VRVPVAVKDDHGIRCLKVQAQATSPGAQQEDEILGPGLVEFLQQSSPVLRLGGAIKAKVQEVPKRKVILHDGHEGRHLAEKQHAVISCSQFWQNTIKQLKLSRGPIQLSPIDDPI